MARKVPLKLHLPPLLKAQIEAIAAERGESIGVIAREAFDAYLTSRSPGMVFEGQSPYLAKPPDTPSTPPAQPRAAS